MEEDSEKYNSVHQPHDKLVKRLLSNPAAAKDIFSLYLPKEVLDIVDLNYLKMQKDSFIDDEHRAYAADILYKTRFLNDEGYLWILLEHQRNSNVWMPVRIFKYIAMIWDHLRKTKQSSSLPLVYPLIIYNGLCVATHKPCYVALLVMCCCIKYFSCISMFSVKRSHK